jgi:hypothetical protein
VSRARPSSDRSSPVRRARSTAPRASRFEPSNRLFRVDDGLAFAPPSTKRQPGRSGQASHSGRGRQTSRPRSMSAWFHAPGSSGLTHAAARSWTSPARASSGSTPRKARATIRRTFVSIAATRAPNEIEAMAATVYGPIPGSRRSATGSLGTRPSWSRAIVRAASDSATARRLYPRPSHSMTTSWRVARASDRSVGNRRRNETYAGTTRAACVCCSIISETRIG